MSKVVGIVDVGFAKDPNSKSPPLLSLLLLLLGGEVLLLLCSPKPELLIAV